MSTGRFVAAGKTRSCPHCKATILDSATVCPGCHHHLRFDSASGKVPQTLDTPLRVDGILRHPPDGGAWEYSIVLAVRNARGEELSRQVVGVGALQPAEERTFSLAVEVFKPVAVSKAAEAVKSPEEGKLSEPAELPEAAQSADGAKPPDAAPPAEAGTAAEAGKMPEAGKAHEGPKPPSAATPVPTAAPYPSEPRSATTGRISSSGLARDPLRPESPAHGGTLKDARHAAGVPMRYPKRP